MLVRWEVATQELEGQSWGSELVRAVVPHSAMWFPAVRREFPRAVLGVRRIEGLVGSRCLVLVAG
jgi:hypothetical protein